MSLAPEPYDLVGLGDPTRPRRRALSPMPGGLGSIGSLPGPDLPEFKLPDPYGIYAPKPAPQPAPQSQQDLPEEESGGILHALGDILSRPGYALRGVLTGRPKAVLGMLPFSESLGLFGDEERVTGQRLLQDWGLMDKGAEEPLLSGKGIAGLAVEMVDPLMLLGGLGALNKAGKSAKLLSETITAANELRNTARVAKAAGNLAKAAELRTQARAILSGIREGTSAAGAARTYLKARNLPMSLAGTAGAEAEAGQRALLTLGGETQLLPFTPAVHLPEMTIARGAPIIEAAADTGRWLKEAPFLRPVTDLFSKAPKGVDEETGRIITQALDEAKATEGAMIGRAAEEASQLSAALRQPDLAAEAAAAAKLEPKPASVVRIGDQMIDPVTGEVLVPESVAHDAISRAAQREKEIRETSEWTHQIRNENDQLKDQLKAITAREQGVPAPIAGDVVQAPPPSPAAVTPIAPEITPAPVPYTEGQQVRYQLPDRRFKKPVTATVAKVYDDGSMMVEYGRKQKALDSLGLAKTETRMVQERLSPDAWKQRVSLSGEAKRAASRQAERDALSQLPTGEAASVRVRGADANKAADLMSVDELAAYGMEPGQRRLAQSIQKTGRDQYVHLHGEGTPLQQRAAGLPKTLEKVIGQNPDAAQSIPETLKSIEIRPHAVEAPTNPAALAEGDQFRLAGEKYTVKELTPDGKVRVKDGLELKFPPEAIPIDRGAGVIKKAEPVLPEMGPLSEPAAITPPPALPSARPDELAKAREALSRGEAKVGVEAFKKRRPNLTMTREAFESDMQRAFRLSDDQRVAVMSIADARAETWAKATGRTADEWYETHIASVSRGQAPKLAQDVEGIAAQQEAIRKGSTRIQADGRAVLKGFQKADVSTAVHELGHVFRRDLPTADLALVEKWAGVKAGTWTTHAEEKFANAFEEYLKTGKSPTPGLAGVFEQFKEWLTNIYRRVVGSHPGAVNPELRDVFDRLLGKTDEAAEAIGKSVPKKPLITMEKNLLGETVVSDASRARLAKKSEQGALFETKLTPEELRARKLVQQHAEEGGKELFQSQKQGKPGRYASVKSLIEQGTRNADSFADIGGVSAEQAARIKSATGLDVAGYVHTVDGSSIQHVLREHAGDAVPLTAEDLERIPAVVSSPDRIVRSQTKQGLDALEFHKRFNGHDVVVEEVRTGRGKLALKTMYKTPAGGVDQARDLTSETLLTPSQAARASDQPLTGLKETLPPEMGPVKGVGLPPTRSGRMALPEERELFQTSTAPRTSNVHGRTAMPDPDLPKAEIQRRIRMAEHSVETLTRNMESIGKDSEEFQQLARSQRAASRDLAFYREWKATSKMPPIGPRATEQEISVHINRTRARAEMEAFQRSDNAIKAYLSRAGVGTREAAEKAAKMLPDASPDVLRTITKAKELGHDLGGKAGELVKALRERDEEMLFLEQSLPFRTPRLQDSRIDYTTRVLTQEGHRYLRRLTAQKRAEMFVKLQEARKAAGVELGDETAEALTSALRKRPSGDLKMVPERYGWGKRQLDRLDKPTRDWISKNKLEREYLAYEKIASTAHPSQIERLSAFRNLSIPELNDAFKKAGARGVVFSEDPAVQSFVRESRHARSIAANKAFTDLAKKIGAEVDKADDFPMPMGNGLEEFKRASGQTGYGVAEINHFRRQSGLPAVLFPDKNTAEAVQKAMTKIFEPEEAEGILRWWDETTKMLKGWVTKPFAPYHGRNRMSNRLQSYLDDVPVAGKHYALATRMLGGQDGVVKLADGRVLNRDEIIKLAQDKGVISGGFFETEFKRELGKDSSWNPLSSRNKFVPAAEKVSATLAGAPGQILSGVKPAPMTAAHVESVDRLGHFIYKLERESVASAADSVKRALFDYSDLNDFEKKVLGRAVFFYAYTRKNLPYMLDRLVQRPGKVGRMASLGIGAGLPEMLPGYAKEGIPVGMGTDTQGRPMVAYGFGTPLEAAVEPFAGFTEGPRRGLEKGLSQLNPLARVPLEVATGRRFFLGRGIEESRKAPHWVDRLPESIQKSLGARKVVRKSGVSYEMDPYDLYLIENSPFGRISTTIGKAVDTDKPVAVRVLNSTTGIKIVSVDQAKEAYFRAKDARAARLKELERHGLVYELPEMYGVTQQGKASPQAAGIKQLVRGR